jgi:hypothetical protein
MEFDETRGAMRLNYSELALKIIKSAALEGDAAFFTGPWYKYNILPLAQRVYIFDPREYEREARKRAQLQEETK